MFFDKNLDRGKTEKTDGRRRKRIARERVGFSRVRRARSDPPGTADARAGRKYASHETLREGRPAVSARFPPASPLAEQVQTVFQVNLSFVYKFNITYIENTGPMCYGYCILCMNRPALRL